jgi:hypothetical protein
MNRWARRQPVGRHLGMVDADVVHDHRDRCRREPGHDRVEVLVQRGGGLARRIGDDRVALQADRPERPDLLVLAGMGIVVGRSDNRGDGPGSDRRPCRDLTDGPSVSPRRVLSGAELWWQRRSRPCCTTAASPSSTHVVVPSVHDGATSAVAISASNRSTSNGLSTTRTPGSTIAPSRSLRACTAPVQSTIGVRASRGLPRSSRSEAVSPSRSGPSSR